MCCLRVILFARGKWEAVWLLMVIFTTVCEFNNFEFSVRRVGGGVETTPHPFVVLRMIQIWLKLKKKLLIQICILVIDIHVHDWYVLFFVFAGKGKLVSKDSKEYKQLLSDTSVLSESIKEQGNSV